MVPDAWYRRDGACILLRRDLDHCRISHQSGLTLAKQGNTRASFGRSSVFPAGIGDSLLNSSVYEHSSFFFKDLRSRNRAAGGSLANLKIGGRHAGTGLAGARS